MKLRGIAPNLTTYNVIFNHYSMSFDEVTAMIKRMKLASINPDTVTYNSIINQNSASFDNALAFLAAMKSDGIEPSQITYSTILARLTRPMHEQNRVHELAPIYKNMNTTPKFNGSYYDLHKVYFGTAVYFIMTRLIHNNAFKLLIGMGNHSKDSVSILGPKLVPFLHDLGYATREENGFIIASKNKKTFLKK